MTSNGSFIAIDGVDGAGNTSHSQLLAEWVTKSLGLKTLLTKEPTEKPIGLLIREYLRKPRTPSTTDALLFAADRIEHVENVIKPALAKGLVVISDRYVESSIAYQSVQGLPIDWLISINRHAMKPSLNIILDIEPDRSLARKKELVEKFEVASFLRKVREVFLSRAKSEDYPVVDTGGSLHGAQNTIRTIVQSFLRKSGL
ncbi:MAG: dTMP kinase [Candidatus Atabeyarchaeum deiterrae]